MYELFIIVYSMHTYSNGRTSVICYTAIAPLMGTITVLEYTYIERSTIHRGVQNLQNPYK